jgi:hypothetical protein
VVRHQCGAYQNKSAELYKKSPLRLSYLIF